MTLIDPSAKVYMLVFHDASLIRFIAMGSLPCVAESQDPPFFKVFKRFVRVSFSTPLTRKKSSRGSRFKVAYPLSSVGAEETGVPAAIVPGGKIVVEIAMAKIFAKAEFSIM
ncbi:hypothetical protein QEV61_00535 [Trueperella pyogenes]|uniref:hypothetical protein n=1 Tax=Trueperella pyogenes TaxID=1661 RepID=UPI003243A525